jgi:predicted transcriptional regulator
VRDGFVLVHGGPRALRYFAAGAQPADERARAAAERSGAEVLAAVRQAPGVDKSRLARELAISRATVMWHLALLERAGLVRYERAGRRVLVFPITF